MIAERRLEPIEMSFYRSMSILIASLVAMIATVTPQAQADSVFAGETARVTSDFFSFAHVASLAAAGSSEADVDGDGYVTRRDIKLASGRMDAGNPGDGLQDSDRPGSPAPGLPRVAAAPAATSGSSSSTEKFPAGQSLANDRDAFPTVFVAGVSEVESVQGVSSAFSKTSRGPPAIA